MDLELGTSWFFPPKNALGVKNEIADNSQKSIDFYEYLHDNEDSELQGMSFEEITKQGYVRLVDENGVVSYGKLQRNGWILPTIVATTAISLLLIFTNL